MLGLGPAWFGPAWLGPARVAPDWVGPGLVWLRVAWPISDCSDPTWPWPGLAIARLGLAWLGPAWLGPSLAWPWPGLALAWPYLAWPRFRLAWPALAAAGLALAWLDPGLAWPGWHGADSNWQAHDCMVGGWPQRGALATTGRVGQLDGAAWTTCSGLAVMGWVRHDCKGLGGHEKAARPR